MGHKWKKLSTSFLTEEGKKEFRILLDNGYSVLAGAQMILYISQEYPEFLKEVENVETK